MDGIGTALRMGMRRARIVLLGQWLFKPDFWSTMIWPLLALILFAIFGSRQIGDLLVDSTQLVTPGLLAMFLVLGGFLGIAGELVVERDDGTLLRMRAVPHGVPSYVVAKLLGVSVTTLAPMLVLLIPVQAVFADVFPDTAGGWALMVAVTLLGLLATLPLGLVAGSVVSSQVMLLIPMGVAFALVAVSGLLFPLDLLPGWLQVLAQLFPVYWLGLGLRAAMLPPEAAVLEIGESWRLAETFAMLGVWSVVGLVLAPIALRRMARNESGSRLAAVRDRVLARGY